MRSPSSFPRRRDRLLTSDLKAPGRDPRTRWHLLRRSERQRPRKDLRVCQGADSVLKGERMIGCVAGVCNERSQGLPSYHRGPQERSLHTEGEGMAAYAT
eukprot:762070-Hanusia_phi.AAC.1